MEFDYEARIKAIDWLISENTGDSLNGTSKKEQIDYSVALHDSEFITDPLVVLNGGTNS